MYAQWPTNNYMTVISVSQSSRQSQDIEATNGRKRMHYYARVIIDMRPLYTIYYHRRSLLCRKYR
jgi:hypothetical protein